MTTTMQSIRRATVTKAGHLVITTAFLVAVNPIAHRIERADKRRDRYVRVVQYCARKGLSFEDMVLF